MARLREMAPLGIFLVAVALWLATVAGFAVFAPTAFCDSLDPGLNPMMDGYGGRVLRSLFVQCQAG